MFTFQGKIALLDYLCRIVFIVPGAGGRIHQAQEVLWDDH
jgi:hypothetical protein